MTSPLILFPEAGQAVVVLAILCSVLAALVVGVLAKKDKLVEEVLVVPSI